MPEEFTELKGPDEPEKKKDFHPRRMKSFIRHLSVATLTAEERSEKKAAVKDHLNRVRNLALNKRSTKQEIETEIGSFESTVKDIIKDEEKILEEQRKETKQIGELKVMVENLSKKLIDIGREYAGELEAKDEKIMELREALASAHIRISESGEDRKKKIEKIEQKLKDKRASPSKPLSRSDHISELESHLKSLESRHKELHKEGKHSKKDLDRVKRLIIKHKENIKKLKSANK